MYVIAVLIVCYFSDLGSTWDYDANGPSEWHTKYKTCAGEHQSPVRIAKHDIINIEMDPLRVKGYEVPQKNCSMLNNGKTVQITLPANSSLVMKGGRLNGHYYLKQFHFHWGHNDSEGSEHHIEQKAYPLEMHLVSTLSNLSFAKASHLHDHAVAVLAVLFDISPDDNPNFAPILEHLKAVKNPGTKFIIPEITIGKLLPANLDTFYSYDGSLTIPPCSENVIWLILKTTLPVSEKQMSDLRRTLATKNRKKILDHNFRPLQSLDGRHIYQRKLGEQKQGLSSHVQQMLNVICKCDT